MFFISAMMAQVVLLVKQKCLTRETIRDRLTTSHAQGEHMEIIIEKGIPITGSVEKGFGHFLKKMEIGESFVAEIEKRGNLSSCISQCKPRKFVTRKISNTHIRCWRIE